MRQQRHTTAYAPSWQTPPVRFGGQPPLRQAANCETHETLSTAFLTDRASPA